MTTENRETLANLQIIGDVSLADLEISDVVLAGTIWATLFAQESSNGTKHEYEKETEAPTVGFRGVNQPKKGTPGVNQLVEIALQVLEVTVEADKALATGYPSSKGGEAAYMAKKSKAKLRAAFHAASRQAIYGTGNDADGFVGLAEATGYTSISDEKVIDGGGSGSDLESVWILRTDEDNVSSVYNGEQGFQFGEIYEQQLTVYDGAGAVQGTYAGLVATILSWLGLQIGSKHSMVRVCNIDHASNDIEDMIQDGLSLFPAGYTPNQIYASRRIARAVQRGRQKTSHEAKRVPMAKDVDGVQLSIAEALLPETALT